MKKILLVILAVFMLCGCTKDNSNLTTVRLNEVAHSIFYAPQYVAIELGYFEEEGIDLELVTGFGADKTMTAVLSGDADIGFMGSEASIYAYSEGAKDYPVNFALLTRRAGNFLVARENLSDFSWDDLKGKTVLGGRAGGMPQMVFEYILMKHDIDPKEDLEIIQNIDFGLTAGAFKSGKGDFTIEFEPGATMLMLEDAGYVVASLGVESGFVPYTAYSARQSYIDDNPEIIAGFLRAIKKGIDYVSTHTSEEIAKVIAPQFSDTDVETIAIIVERYKNQDSWKTDLVFDEDGYDLLIDILKKAGELDKEVPYDDLVTSIPY